MSETEQIKFQTMFEKIPGREFLIEKAEEMANLGYWHTNFGNGKTGWSEEMYRIFGYEPGSFEPSMDVFLNHVHPDDLSFLQNSIYEIDINDGYINTEYRIVDNYGSIKYLKGGHLIYPDENGDVIKVEGFAKDDSKIKLLELQLKDSQAHYQAITANTTTAFFVSNIKGNILETNNAASVIFGYTDNEFKTLTRQHLLEIDDPKFIVALQNREKTGRMKGEVAGFKKNRERILLEYTSTKFLNVNNEERFVTLMADITSRKQQEEVLLKSNERFEQVSKATFDAIWDWDVKSKQLYLGEGFKELFGYDIKNNTGDFSTWYNHIHPDDKEKIILSRLNKIIHHTESTWKDEYRYIRADGSIAYISDRGVLLRNSIGTYRMIGAMQDVTELKQNEIAISNLNKSLEKRAEELAVSNEELERFAYVASHDLQEPLRMVTSFLQLLQKKYDEQLDETAEKYINYAVDGAERMKALIMDLLDYSRISSDKQNHTEIDLNELISKTLQVLKPLVDETGASIVIPHFTNVSGNSSQLMRLFQNLISNALKYRSVLKPIIEIGFSETRHEWEFFVKDNGIGIDAKYFEKIFIIFQRLHSRTEYTGTGIGLAICKKIVDLHGGRIWVESSLQTGSRFYFTISKYQAAGNRGLQPADADFKRK